MRNYYEKDKVPVPDGYSVCRAMLGFDIDGELLIYQCNEDWTPYDFDSNEDIFVGAVQRIVYYRKIEEHPPETITYMMVNSDNSVSLCDVPTEYDPACDAFIAGDNYNPTPLIETTKQVITREKVFEYDATLLRENMKALYQLYNPPTATVSGEGEDRETQAEKPSDDFLARALSQPRKGPFDK